MSGWSPLCEACFLIIDAGKDRGIWASNGIDPEWVTRPTPGFTATDITQMIESGIKIGFWPASEPLITRSTGMDLKIVASYWGDCLACKILVQADSPIKTPRDMNGRKIGVLTSHDWSYRFALIASKKFTANTEFVPLGNLTNQVVALKLGRVDAIVTGTAPALRLVDSGELKILLEGPDVYPRPYATQVVWATGEIIDQNPDLVGRFVKATLEIVNYLKDNPSYAADLYIKRTNVPRDLADKAVSQIDWQPSGRGSGQSLTLAVANVWQYNKDSGAIPADVNLKIEDAVDVRFLP